jgi:hypothetical protein
MSRDTGSGSNLQQRWPATPAQIIARIQALELFFPKSVMKDPEKRLWFATYCEDLKLKSDAEIAYACLRYRQDPTSRFFPTPGQLLELCTSPFADKLGRSNGRVTEEAGWQPWGGGCQCDRCMKKIPREGFHRAPRADYTRDAATREELDYDMEQKLGYDPKRGNPALDNTLERQRTPEELKALLESTRRKYPRAFRSEALPCQIKP